MAGHSSFFLLSGNRAFGRWIKKSLFSSVWEFEGKRRELEKKVKKICIPRSRRPLFFGETVACLSFLLFFPFRICGFFPFLFLEKFRYFPLFLALPEEESSLPGRRRQKNQKLWTTVVLPHTRVKKEGKKSATAWPIFLFPISISRAKKAERGITIFCLENGKATCVFISWMDGICMYVN